MEYGFKDLLRDEKYIIKIMSVSMQEDMIALGIMGKLCIYDCKTQIKDDYFRTGMRSQSKSQRKIAEFPYPNTFPQSIDWNNKSPNVLAAADSEFCKIYDVQKQTNFNNYNVLKHINSISWSKFNQNQISCCTNGNVIYILDTDSQGKAYHTIQSESKVEKVAFSYTNEHILASSHVDGVYIWDIRKADKFPLKYHSYNHQNVHNLHFDRVNGLLLLAKQKSVHIYSESNFQNPLEINRSRILSAKFVPSESGFAMIEKKKTDISNNINFYSLSTEYDNLVAKKVETLALPQEEAIMDLCFRRDPDMGLQVIFNTRDTKMLKSVGIPLATVEKLPPSPSLKKLGFHNGEESKENSISNEALTKDCEQLSEDLSVVFHEDISIKISQKFSMNQYLYKVECKSSRLEARILVNVSNLDIYQVEYKLNLSEKFEEYLEQSVKLSSNKNNKEEFFHIVVEAMKACDLTKLDFTSNEEEKYLFNNVPENDPIKQILDKSGVPGDDETPFEPYGPLEKFKQPFVPSPRTSGCCWSPHGYLVHFKSSSTCDPKTKGVSLYSKHEILKFIENNKEKLENKFKFNSAHKIKSVDSNHFQDSDSDNSLDEFQTKPSVFNQIHQDGGDLNISTQMEESYKRGFFNKSNDLLISKNQMSMVAMNIGISYSFATKATILEEDVQTICQNNILAGTSMKRMDIVKLWKMISISLSKDIISSTIRQKIWNSHPTGWLLIKKLILSMEERRDIQSICMIAICLYKTNETVAVQGIKRGVIAKLIPEDDFHYWKKLSKYIVLYCEVLSRWNLRKNEQAILVKYAAKMETISRVVEDFRKISSAL
ncbi:unnamed protein product [Moneuplotes crassus]|uniref:Uncharacterized protein n=1 Tax=Euplotes crassus TaxID=5936 RepID=A0AAD1Y5U1_EUPCR|nr:unnamed protein product [Moneuplotes crassus]